MVGIPLFVVLLAYQGLAEEEYTLFSDVPLNVTTVLPLEYDSTNDDVYVHAHGQTVPCQARIVD